MYRKMQILKGVNLKKPQLHIHPLKADKENKYRWPELVAKIGDLLDMLGNDAFKGQVYSHRASHIARAGISRKSQLHAHTSHARHTNAVRAFSKA